MVNLLVTWIPALLIAVSAVMKIAKNPRIVQEMTPLGVGKYLQLLGVMELVFAAMFVIPATSKLGFILLSSYFGGAIATELSHGVPKINPYVPLVLLWVCAFIKDRSIFF